jgi:hypothetical protein
LFAQVFISTYFPLFPEGGPLERRPTSSYPSPLVIQLTPSFCALPAYILLLLLPLPFPSLPNVHEFAIKHRFQKDIPKPPPFPTVVVYTLPLSSFFPARGANPPSSYPSPPRCCQTETIKQQRQRNESRQIEKNKKRRKKKRYRYGCVCERSKESPRPRLGCVFFHVPPDAGRAAP